MFSSSPEEVVSEDIVLAKIEMLRTENTRLLQELKQQDEYDRSRGIPPGKFREHFTMHCIGIKIRHIARYFSFTESQMLTTNS